MADHSTLAAAASISCNIAVCGLFLSIADTHQARLPAADDQGAWAEGALQRRRAQARQRARRRRREVQPRPYQPPLPYTRFSFNIDVWEDAWVKKRMP